jgi:hypothetical protein
MLCHSTWITFYHALRDESFLITWMAQVQVVRFQKIGIPSSKPTMAAMRIRGSFLGKNDYKWRTNTMSSLLLPEGITLRSGNVVECWNLHQRYSMPYKNPTSASHIWSSTSFALATSRSRSPADTCCRGYLRLLHLGFYGFLHAGGIFPVETPMVDPSFGGTFLDFSNQLLKLTPWLFLANVGAKTATRAFFQFHGLEVDCWNGAVLKLGTLPSYG